MTALLERRPTRRSAERERLLRQAPFALRVVRRTEGVAGIVYRRISTPDRVDRLVNAATVSPLAFTAGRSLMTAASRSVMGRQVTLEPGPFVPLDLDWGARIACFARVTAGLREPDRISRAAGALQHATGTEAAFWLGLIERDPSSRTIRALRILTEATQ